MTTGNLFGGDDALSIELDPLDAAAGIDKAVALPSGGPPIIVRVPAGVLHGTVLRLTGADTADPSGPRDVRVRVLIRSSLPPRRLDRPAHAPASPPPSPWAPTSVATSSYAAATPNSYAPTPAPSPYAPAYQPPLGSHRAEAASPWDARPTGLSQAQGAPTFGAAGTGGFQAGGGSGWSSGQQPVPRKRGGAWRYIVIGIAVLVVLGGGGAAIALSGKLGGATPGAKGSPSASASPAAKALTAQEYQAVLSEVDSTMTPAVAAIVEAKNPTTLSKAATDLAAAAQAGHLKLKVITPPKTAATAHASFVAALAEFAALAVETGMKAGRGDVCAGSSAVPHITNAPAAESVRSAVKDLAAVDAANPIKAGAWLPAPATEQTRKLANGTFVKKGSRTGAGELKIDNIAGTADAAISLVPAGTKTTSFSVYVRAGSSFKVTGVKDGSYDVYETTGVDWDPALPGFSRSCGFDKFQKPMDYQTTSSQYTTWTVTLKAAAGGNAPTDDVNPSDFPQ